MPEAQGVIEFPRLTCRKMEIPGLPGRPFWVPQSVLLNTQFADAFGSHWFIGSPRRGEMDRLQLLVK